VTISALPSRVHNSPDRLRAHAAAGTDYRYGKISKNQSRGSERQRCTVEVSKGVAGWTPFVNY